MSDRTAEEFAKHAALVELRFGDVLHRADSVQEYVYFPTSGVVSLLYVMESGLSAEVGLTGRDGLVGVAAVLEGASATTKAMVQAPGYALRIPARKLQRIIQGDGALRLTMMRYVQVLMTQMIQTAICNRHHTLAQQLGRWLLHMTDLVQSKTVTMTQQLMAEMLGARREAVSVVATKMRHAGVITYSRGTVTVLNRAKLEAQSCECYEVVVKETLRLLPPGRGEDGYAAARQRQPLSKRRETA